MAADRKPAHVFPVMTESHPQLVSRAIATVLGEILHGATPKWGWLLNRNDPGLLRSLDRLSAEQASALASGGGASIAAHVDHLRYGFELLNQWSRGENPWAGADWTASWRRLEVSASEWESLRSQLRTEAERWLAGFDGLTLDKEADLTGVIASAAHLAYHLGAIRQIDRATRGPSAEE